MNSTAPSRADQSQEAEEGKGAVDLPFDFDVIVIGSGFGGSVMTLRLTEQGHRVCLLERGTRYPMQSFPRQMHDFRSRVFWDPEDGRNGFMEFDAFPNSDAYSVRASGLGGGSLIYASVLYRMPAPFFTGWPAGLTREVMDPFYSRVEETMEASPYPFADHAYYAHTQKTRLFQEAASKLTPAPDCISGPQFVLPPLAIRFSGSFPGEQSLNGHGVIQSSCTKCGECDVGCNIHAKNTLDLNYLARAENAALLPADARPAEIRTSAEVLEIRPLTQQGYSVRYHNPTEKGPSTTIRARRVVVSAGSIGSTALLLKMKKHGQLPHTSPALGSFWCGNGDLEGTVLKTHSHAVPTNGPVITAAIEYAFEPYEPGFPHGFVIQDAGFPSFIAWYLMGRLGTFGAVMNALRSLARLVRKAMRRILHRILSLHPLRRFRPEINIGDDIASFIDRDDVVRHTYLLLGMGRDINDGRILLSDDDQPIIRWKMARSKPHYDRLRREMGKIAKAMGGHFQVNPLTYLNRIIAVHPIGGCIMGDDPEHGVVDGYGEVFGHPGLYVVDASILPTSTGPNPSLTIAAMAERIADRFPPPPRP